MPWRLRKRSSGYFAQDRRRRRGPCRRSPRPRIQPTCAHQKPRCLRGVRRPAACRSACGGSGGGGPPEHALLQRALRAEREQELERAPRLERAVREVAVVAAGHHAPCGRSRSPTASARPPRRSRTGSRRRWPRGGTPRTRTWPGGSSRRGDRDAANPVVRSSGGKSPLQDGETPVRTGQSFGHIRVRHSRPGPTFAPVFLVVRQSVPILSTPFMRSVRARRASLADLAPAGEIPRNDFELSPGAMPS